MIKKTYWLKRKDGNGGAVAEGNTLIEAVENCGWKIEDIIVIKGGN